MDDASPSPVMWTAAQSWFATHRATLAAAGIFSGARLEQGRGLYSGYVDGTVRLTLPDPSTPEGLLRTLLLGGMLDLSEEEVLWLFRAMLPRLVAHELGHALRAEAGRLGPDVLEEEQVADRLATLLSGPHLLAQERARMLTLLGRVTQKLGGLEEAASLHRHAWLAWQQLGLSAAPPVAARARAHLQATYHRDVPHYLRMSVGWTWLDLVLEVEDSLEAFRRDHLALPQCEKPGHARATERRSSVSHVSHRLGALSTEAPGVPPEKPSNPERILAE